VGGNEANACRDVAACGERLRQQRITMFPGFPPLPEENLPF